MKKTTQGFTLIELLVVIAIIGILSSIVIASLNSARTKGSVAAAKGQLAQLRTQAENYYDNNGGYATSSVTAAQTTCNAANTMFVDSTIATQITQIGTNVLATNCGMSADRQKFRVSVQLKDSTFWCVDNQGANKPVTALPTDVTATGAGTCN
jgi:prepilin-type N-terminal cleavage/methylation domain-containing protein